MHKIDTELNETTPVMVFKRLGALIMRMRGGVKHSPPREHRKSTRKTSEINDLENEPGHVWRLLKVLRVTKDDI